MVACCSIPCSRVNPKNQVVKPHIQLGSQVPRTTTRMDIDINALTKKFTEFEKEKATICKIFWERHLCFSCLKVFDPAHQQGGIWSCPNIWASPLDCLAILKSAFSQTKAVHLNALHVNDSFWIPGSQEHQEETQILVPKYLESSFTGEHITYPTKIPDSSLPTLEISALRISGNPNCSTNLNISVTLRTSEGLLTIQALIDTGSEGNFIDSSFAPSRKNWFWQIRSTLSPALLLMEPRVLAVWSTNLVMVLRLWVLLSNMTVFLISNSVQRILAQEK